MARTRGSADSHYKSLEGKKVLITGALPCRKDLWTQKLGCLIMPCTMWPHMSPGDGCTCAGGSAGIGKAAAIAFSNNGAIVTITGRRQERLDDVVAQLKQVHSGPLSLHWLLKSSTSLSLSDGNARFPCPLSVALVAKSSVHAAYLL